jgi:hypothetical protein
MTNYLQALTALEYLLGKAGESHWRDWLRQDIALWQSEKDVSHHLSAYGAMGSLNDVWISAEDGYISHAQEPWVNNLFDLLKGLCHRLASTPDEDQALGDPSISREYPIQLHGWRCLQCAHAETRPHDIDDYLAKEILPNLASRPKSEQDWRMLVDAAFTGLLDGLAAARGELTQTILKSGIKIADREGWMRPCPSCGSDNTAVYRWELAGTVFQASTDNLSLQKRAP